jgi:hypothetical protein
MQENTKLPITAPELFQSWTRQPFGETLPDSLLPEWEAMLGFYSQGKQFVYVYDYKAAGVAFVSGNIRNVLGYEPEAISAEFFYSKMHPADQDEVLKITRASGEMVLQHKEIEPL